MTGMGVGIEAAVLNHHPAEADPMTNRILDACHTELLANGTRGLSVEQVARRAGTARITIYRRFPRKADLVNAVLLREGRRLFARADELVAEVTSPEERLVEGFVATFTLARHHPLVRRILSEEPDLAVPFATTAAGPIIALARRYFADHLRRPSPAGRRSGRAPAGKVTDPEPVAELVVRLSLSFLLAPASCIALETPEDGRAFARRFLLPMLEGGRRPAGVRR